LTRPRRAAKHPISFLEVQLDQAALLQRVMLLIPLILSLTVHEFFHAWTAWRLGDDTAARLGRMTLNPLPHIDLVGTILLPLAGIPFGWAKPVPVDIRRIRRDISMTKGNILISSAGPLSNIALAILASVVYALLIRWAPGTIRGGAGAGELLEILILVNVGLAIFNLLPIPPLDGSHVAEALVPARFRGAWEAFARVSPFVLIAFFFLGRGLLTGPRNWVLGLLEALINSIARA
jgi:Zn-dependent protease